MTCKDCIHYELCSKNKGFKPCEKYAEIWTCFRKRKEAQKWQITSE